MLNECFMYFLDGGPVLYTIFVFSVIAWIFIFHKLMVFKNTGTQSHRRHDEIINIAKDNRVPEALNICKSNNGLYSKIIHNTLLLKGHTPHQFDMASSVNLLGEKRKLECFNGTIGLIARMCPLLGLLGTVMGMISTFYVITIYGTGEPGLMGKGISQALITTQVGLFLAVPILFFYEFLENKKQGIKWEMELYIKKLKTVLCGNNGMESLRRGQKDTSRPATQLERMCSFKSETNLDRRQLQETKT
jgi:biopolymer transport protein ExbB